jgi:hypothetical protein
MVNAQALAEAIAKGGDCNKQSCVDSGIFGAQE